MTTTQRQGGPRRLRATIISVGLDGDGGPRRIIAGTESLVIGGSEETHSEMLETMLRLESELDRLGKRLGDMTPSELIEIAWRIDSPELQEIAHRISSGLEDRGQSFDESTAEELTALATGRTS